LKHYQGYAIKLYPSKDISKIEFILKDDEPYTRFNLKEYGSFEVWGFGVHIAIDASCAILAALATMKLEDIKSNLQKYKGIKKRFDIVQKYDDFVVIDDYAHHPTEIKEVLNGVKEVFKKEEIICIFQPHRISRLKDLRKEFSSSFKRANSVILCPIYSAGEKLKLGFNYFDYAKEIIKNSKVKVFLVKDQYQLAKFIKQNVYGKKIVIGMGAGSISNWIRELPNLI